MNALKRNRNSINNRYLALLVGCVLMLPVAVLASHFEISRLASELHLASDQLAHQLHHTRGYGSVHQRAQSLSRDSAKLAEAVRRNRSQSYIRSQFRDVRRRYNRLEDAFRRANRNNYNSFLYNEIGLINNLFRGLNNEFNYAGNVGLRARQPYNYSASIIASHRRVLPPAFRGGSGFVRPNGNRNWSGRARSRFNYGNRSALRQHNFDHRRRNHNH